MFAHMHSWEEQTANAGGGRAASAPRLEDAQFEVRRLLGAACTIFAKQLRTRRRSFQFYFTAALLVP